MANSISTMLTIFLIINAAFLLHQSHAIKKLPNHSTYGPSASPRSSLHHSRSIPPRDDLKVEFSPLYIEFLNKCEKRMTRECSGEIVGNIFKGLNITNRCCSKLIHMGPDCHKALVEREKELIKDENERKKIVGRSEDLYKRCEKVVKPLKGHNYPHFPPKENLPWYQAFLKECAMKMTKKCADEVVGVIFQKGKSVDKGCCDKLVNMGKECHEELVKGLVNLGRDNKKFEAGKIKKKSEEVWKKCSKKGHLVVRLS